MTAWVIGNWKLNPTSLLEVKTLAQQLVQNVYQAKLDDVQLMVAPSFVHLSAVQSELSHQEDTEPAILLASQDVSAMSADIGAYTGEVSANQLVDMDVDWVIVGHSERRQYFDEDNDLLLQKIRNAQAKELGVIFCIGESEADYQAEITEKVLAEQLQVIYSVFEQTSSDIKLIIAYEPVWAIGTGRVPSTSDVDSVHKFIRQQLANMDAKLHDVPIIYGGSVKPDNAKDFANLPSVNGVLVGGAALDADSFLAIAQSFVE